jgi:glycogen(starch) synthase
MMGGTMAEPLRVLAVANAYPPHDLGGYEIIQRGVMGALRDAGHRVRVLTTDHRNPTVPAAAPEDPDVHRELRWYWQDHGWPAMSLRARMALERANAAVLDRQLRDFQPDVVTWWAMGGLSLGLIEDARRRGLPAVLFVLDYWLSYGPQRDQWMRLCARLGPARAVVSRVTGLPTRTDYASAGRWLFCSRAVRDSAFAAARLRSADTAVLTPGVDRAFLDVAPEASIPDWGWRLLYAGRVVAEKGVDTAIRCLAELPGEATLRIVGDGDPPYRAELRALAARLGVAERVSMEPPRPHDELPALLREADAVLFPVRWAEPWGLIGLEAMAVGRPVVATGRGGSGDYLRDEDNTLLFDADRPDGLAACLRRLAADPSLRERLRERGRATAAAHDETRFNRSAVSEVERAAERR